MENDIRKIREELEKFNSSDRFTSDRGSPRLSSVVRVRSDASIVDGKRTIEPRVMNVTPTRGMSLDANFNSKHFDKMDRMGYFDSKGLRIRNSDNAEQAFKAINEGIRISSFTVSGREHLRTAFEDSQKPFESNEKKRHSESINNLRSIVKTIRESFKEEEDSFPLRVRLFMDRFYRNPVWMTLKMAMQPLAFAGRWLWRGFRTLFMGTRRGTVQERILRAIQDQTILMRTGRIRRREWLDRGGLIGQARRGFRAVTGRSTGRLQGVMDRLQRGERVGTLSRFGLAGATRRGDLDLGMYDQQKNIREKDQKVQEDIRTSVASSLHLLNLIEQNTRSSGEFDSLIREVVREARKERRVRQPLQLAHLPSNTSPFSRFNRSQEHVFSSTAYGRRGGRGSGPVRSSPIFSTIMEDKNFSEERNEILEESFEIQRKQLAVLEDLDTGSSGGGGLGGRLKWGVLGAISGTISTLASLLTKLGAVIATVLGTLGMKGIRGVASGAKNLGRRGWDGARNLGRRGWESARNLAGRGMEGARNIRQRGIGDLARRGATGLRTAGGAVSRMGIRGIPYVGSAVAALDIARIAGQHDQSGLYGRFIAPTVDALSFYDRDARLRTSDRMRSMFTRSPKEQASSAPETDWLSYGTAPAPSGPNPREQIHNRRVTIDGLRRGHFTDGIESGVNRPYPQVPSNPMNQLDRIVEVMSSRQDRLNETLNQRELGIEQLSDSITKNIDRLLDGLNERRNVPGRDGIDEGIVYLGTKDLL